MKRVFEGRGYGFLRDEDGLERFFPLREIAGGQRLRAGAEVLFEAREGRKGPAAAAITRHNGPPGGAPGGAPDPAESAAGEPPARRDSRRGFAVHIGEGVGEKLYADIENAREEVKVVSPYLSVGYLKTLARLERRGVRVTLVTSTDYESAISSEGDRREAGRLLVLQRRHTRRRTARLKRVGLPVSVLVALAGLLMALITFGSPASAPPQALTLGLALLGLSVVAAVALSALRAHYYTYESVFERLRVWDGRSSGAPALHAKLYVVDGRVAYLGSANFTVSGLRHNHECLAELEDPEEVGRISREIEALCSEESQPFLTDLSALGRRAYGER